MVQSMELYTLPYLSTFVHIYMRAYSYSTYIHIRTHISACFHQKGEGTEIPQIFTVLIWFLNQETFIKIGVVAIALTLEAVSTSETSINIYQSTRRNIPGDSHLHLKGRLLCGGLYVPRKRW
jgi:hypothetical protein